MSKEIKLNVTISLDDETVKRLDTANEKLAGICTSVTEGRAAITETIKTAFAPLKELTERLSEQVEEIVKAAPEKPEVLEEVEQAVETPTEPAQEEAVEQEPAATPIGESVQEETQPTLQEFFGEKKENKTEPEPVEETPSVSALRYKNI